MTVLFGNCTRSEKNTAVNRDCSGDIVGHSHSDNLSTHPEPLLSNEANLSSTANVNSPLIAVNGRVNLPNMLRDIRAKCGMTSEAN